MSNIASTIPFLPSCVTVPRLKFRTIAINIKKNTTNNKSTRHSLAAVSSKNSRVKSSKVVWNKTKAEDSCTHEDNL